MRDLVGIGADDGQVGVAGLGQGLESGEQGRQTLALLGAADEDDLEAIAVVGLGAEVGRG